MYRLPLAYLVVAVVHQCANGFHSTSSFFSSQLCRSTDKTFKCQSLDAVESIPLDHELSKLSRSSLQDLAKKFGIKANIKSDFIIAQLQEARTGLLKTTKIISESPQPIIEEAQDDDDDSIIASNAEKYADSEWTEAKISSKISVLQRKLREVQALDIVALNNPQSLNEEQAVKLRRKTSIQDEISMLEKLRISMKHGVSGSPVHSKKLNDEEKEPKKEVDELLNLPKKLAIVLSYCRISTRETCELLVAMGRITVNGVTVYNPDLKVDILNDVIMANNIRVTLPEKFDNAKSSPIVERNLKNIRKSREKSNAGKFDRYRTGPIPKSEKPPTWKQITKYSWQVDGGLMARKVRGEKPKDGNYIDNPRPRRY